MAKQLSDNQRQFGACVLKAGQLVRRVMHKRRFTLFFGFGQRHPGLNAMQR